MKLSKLDRVVLIHKSVAWPIVANFTFYLPCVGYSHTNCHRTTGTVLTSQPSCRLQSKYAKEREESILGTFNAVVALAEQIGDTSIRE